jgi:hypothetical protein
MPERLDNSRREPGDHRNDGVDAVNKLEPFLENIAPQKAE